MQPVIERSRSSRLAKDGDTVLINNRSEGSRRQRSGKQHEIAVPVANTLHSKETNVRAGRQHHSVHAEETLQRAEVALQPSSTVGARSPPKAGSTVADVGTKTVVTEGPLPSHDKQIAAMEQTVATARETATVEEGRPSSHIVHTKAPGLMSTPAEANEPTTTTVGAAVAISATFEAAGTSRTAPHLPAYMMRVRPLPPARQ